MFKVGVVGLGWMGRVHLRNYTEMADVEVVGVVDVDTEVLKEVEGQFGVKTYTSLDELLENDLDVMSVCVPTSLHHETGLKIIEKKINLIIEKPLAATAAEGRELVLKAEDMGIKLMVGHVERFNPAVARVKELIGDAEDVISIQIERVGPYPPRIQDVGVIKDLGSHDIDLLRYLSGSDFKSVYAVCSTSIGKHEDSALITAEMENGVLANISTNWVTPYKGRNISVACESKYIHANLITQEVKEYSAFSTYDKSYSVREWPLMFREPVKEELTQFLNALRNGTEVPIPGSDGLEVLNIFERILGENK
ncbi:gfo/Idh/MocA family oxidoreductase [Pseudodesulfovibrio cashew]|uniref:Gfo/Idh/MocA family oxidoreductase n=1 Tax=Pseudodesulfovibrio cashew TaxID=2678688 RepID=A0A6I6JGM4_9BACT|nr:Gfo/Idh/MocA family oxidoreductase [Pseudodesulfovibrio cashew]QGY40168.1 gfo/Idh/MocA family oxidoreductase [Pseudodesulfovibrio cashew]